MKMKKIGLTAAATCAVILSAFAGNPAAGDGENPDKLSYALGVNTGASFGQQFGTLPLDMEIFFEGLHDGEAGSSGSSEGHIETLQAFFTQPDPSFKDNHERSAISYALGADMGINLQKSGFPIRLQPFEKGMKEVLAGKSTMTETEATELLNHYFLVVVPAKNKAEGERWLAEVARQPGVKKTASGLLYRIDKKGSTREIARDDRDRVLVRYTGWNRSGEQFDSSSNHGGEGTIEFPLDGVIKGWTEGMKLVGKGGKITLWIPSELAYGEKGASSMIPANSALHFEVEVVDVIPHNEE